MRDQSLRRRGKPDRVCRCPGQGGTAAEVTPVSEIGPYKFKVGEIAKNLMEDYSSFVQPARQKLAANA